MTKSPAVFLMGPTASGKSALAVHLALQLNAEIISVDSALVYRGMDIGTAKPTLAERAGVVHHLLDILDPTEAYSTGQFRTQALDLMQAITRRGKLPLLVGGTMLYFNVLSQGMAQLPEGDAALRKALEADLAAEGKEAMHARLAAIDPVAAARIHPNDPQRVQRALEVFMLTGQTLTDFIRASETQALPFNILKLVVAPNDRKVLHARIAERFRTMLHNGLLAEVERLYQRGDLHADLPSMRAVGYRQAWAYLAGEDNLAEMTEKGIAATRQLAKRQFTWLRKETDAQWFESEQADLYPAVLQCIQAFCQP